MRIRNCLTLLALVAAVAVPSTAAAGAPPPDTVRADSAIVPAMIIRTTINTEVVIAREIVQRVIRTHVSGHIELALRDSLVRSDTLADSTRTIALTSLAYGRSTAGLLLRPHREPMPDASTHRWRCHIASAAASRRSMRPPSTANYVNHVAT